MTTLGSIASEFRVTVDIRLLLARLIGNSQTNWESDPVSDPNKQATPLPPYLPYSTFKSFIELLHSNVLPPTIDKSLMRHLAGGVQSHLMGALRFLGLIGPKGEATDRLANLHATFAKPDDWTAELRTILVHAYARLLGSNDVSRMTDKQLDDAFKTGADLDGVMLDRATRFFIQAMVDAKVSVSPFLLNRKRRPTPKRAPKSAKNGNGAAHPEETPAGQQITPPKTEYTPPAGSMEYPIYFRGGKMQGRLIVPAGLTTDDVKMIELLIPMLRAYAAPAGNGDK